MIERYILQQMQSLPLELKIKKSQERIREWYNYWNGNVYVAFSGGKDSTVLLNLVRNIYPEVPAVFCDTGLEYPEIKEFIRTIDNAIWLKPKMSFKQVLDKYGYPIISKEVSYRIYLYHTSIKNNKPQVTNRLLYGRESDGGFKIPEKWKFLLDAPFKINSECCHVMKKAPLKIFERKNNKKPFIGTMASDSRIRLTHYLKHGCNAFDKKQPTSQPLSFWIEEDIWNYLKSNNVNYSSLYNMGYKRSGCLWCCFGVHLEKEPNRFQLMSKTHPKLYEYCINDLGIGKVLDYIGVNYT